MNRTAVCVAIFVTLIFSIPASALFGTRPMGMGGAYTALADDYSAIYWNPAGLAINPGIELGGSTMINNRNQTIGDNQAALKVCLETELDSPFAWMLGVGAASVLALEGAQYLSDQGVVKKNWGRSEPATSRDHPVTNQTSRQENAQPNNGTGPEGAPQVTTRKEMLGKVADTFKKGAVAAANDLGEEAGKAARVQTNYYFYSYPWYAPNYYRPTYWDNRYAYTDEKLTPRHKAQFAGGFGYLFDKNALLNQNTNWYSFSLATAWEEIASVGANLNVYDIEEISTKTKGLGAGFDAGALLRFSDRLFLGVTAQEILTTDIHWTDGREPTRYAMKINGGIAIKPVQCLVLAVDNHNALAQGGLPSTMHYGIEFRPIYGVALRGGLYDGSKTAGISIGVGEVILDYAYLGGAFDRTHMIGGSWKF